MADAFDGASHDRLTRMLQGTWSEHTLIEQWRINQHPHPVTYGLHVPNLFAILIEGDQPVFANLERSAET